MNSQRLLAFVINRGKLPFPLLQAAIALCCLLLMGCARDDRGFVQREWSMTMRELGIVPIFPPREDFLVGDVYLHEYDPESDAVREVFETKWSKLDATQRQLRVRLGMSPRLARLDINPELAAEYKRSLAAPQTPGEYDLIFGSQLLPALNQNLANAEAALKAIADKLEVERKKAEEAGKAVETAKTKKDDAEKTFKKEEAALKDPKDPRTQPEKQAAFDKAKAELETATGNLTNAQTAKTAADGSYAKLQAETASALAKAQDDVKTAKVIRDAVAKDGVRTMYPQPRDNLYNIYDLSPLQTAEGEKDAVQNARVNRLRLVGFPEFSTVSFTQGDLAALVPLEALLVGLNISTNSVDRVSVSVPSAESYGLSLVDVYRHLPHSYDKRLLRDDWMPAIRFNTDPNQAVVWLRVITEVYYARALDVRLFSNQAFGLRAQGNLPVADGQTVEPPQSANFPVSSTETGSPTADATISNINARIGTAQPVPGGTVQFLGYAESSIGVRRIYDRPIAIGFRGIVLEVRLCDGFILSASPSSSNVPQLVDAVESRNSGDAKR